jgi:pimeloyl-ACP methyl ester carboxylesterase
MTGRSLTQWRAEGELVPLTVRGRSATVFRRVAGSFAGEVWTLLHGWPTTSWDWAAIAPAIERSHRTLLLDWPGLGASSKGDGVDYSIDALAETVIALWHHDGIAATRIVAHDVGTTVAQELLARGLEDRLDVEIVSVTWLNGSLYPDLDGSTQSPLPLLDDATDPAMAAAIDAELYCAGLADVHHPAHQPSSETLGQHWIAFGGSESAREMPRFLRYIPERYERADRLVGAIETTGVVQRFIWGDSDPISGRAQSARLQERLGPGVDLVSFADCSHYPHTERPRDVAQEMLRPWGESAWVSRRLGGLVCPAPSS